MGLPLGIFTKMNTDVSNFSIEPLDRNLSDATLSFLERVFTDEQDIPKELIPLDTLNQKWWCIRKENQIVGIVAAWELDREWHWGRLAIDTSLRGLGLGKRLVIQSLTDCFQSGIPKVTIDARDITVSMILKLGGKITGEKTTFYGHPITPMEIHHQDFKGFP